MGVLASLWIASSGFATTSFVAIDFDRTAWEAAAGSFSEETFTDAIAQSDVLDFATGIQSVASDPLDPMNPPPHFVDDTIGRLRVNLRTPTSTVADGFLTVVWTFPVPITAFGADFYSIGGSREVSVQGSFDSGLEAFELRTLFGNAGGTDQGFFGFTSSVAFTEVTLIAPGDIASNDAITIDNVVFAPEPAGSGAAALGVLALVARRLRRTRQAPLTAQDQRRIVRPIVSRRSIRSSSSGRDVAGAVRPTTGRIAPASRCRLARVLYRSRTAPACPPAVSGSIPKRST